MKYSEKLRDPRWQRKRLEIFARDNFTCLSCGDTKGTLNCHHKYYAGNPWDALDENLETLCESCHEERSFLNKIFMGVSTRNALRYWRLMLNDSEVEGWAIQAIDNCLGDEDFSMRLLQIQHDIVMTPRCRNKIDKALKKGDIH